MSDLGIYRLVPMRPPDDPSWELAPYRGEVIVRAESGGEARVLASEALEKGENPDPAARIDAAYGSAFGDSNLYSARLDESGAYLRQGLKGVLHVENRTGQADGGGSGNFTA